jgi:site-specific DNA-methyltransferase (adenine-specific)
MYHGRCEEVLKTLPDKSIDIVMTDPPYKYLTKSVDWDGEDSFNELEVFTEWHRLVKPDGFVCFFGRGDSFYRWNTILDKIGFRFLEEIIWNKNVNSSFVAPLCRVHETCAIRGFDDSHIRRSRIKFQEDCYPDFNALRTHIDRISRVFDKDMKNKKIQDLRKFLETGEKVYDVNSKIKHQVTVKGNKKKVSDEMMSLNVITEGYLEKSIIDVLPEHLHMIHPTQKPVDILRRIMKLCRPEREGVVLDCFSGSGSTGIACMEDGRKYIGIEQCEKYYNDSLKRLKNGPGELLF